MGFQSEKVIGVVLAAGHGSLQPAQSKLIELLADEPIVRQPVRLLRDDIGLNTLVVRNSKYGDQVQQALKEHRAGWFVHQEKRTGTAGALKECTKQLLFLTASHVVVLYGDMPCWKRPSIEKLIATHLANNSAISMFRIDVRNEYGRYVSNFGRILSDEHGQIIGVREPYEMTEDDLQKAHWVNPSAWVFNAKWLKDSLSFLEPHDKGDGFSHEYWLPDLVPIAVKQGCHITQVDLEDPREAFGVNTLEELEKVRQLTTAGQQET